MDYYIPKKIQGRGPDGRPFMFFRGIHVVPDALANSSHANDLGIKPVEEMTDAEWSALALDKAKWMAANRPAPEVVDAQAEDPEANETPAPVVKPVPAPTPVAPAATATATTDTKSA